MSSSASETVTESLAELGTKVGGMHCSLCAGIVERTLREQPGVANVSVSLADERALIEYDPGRVSREQLLGALGDPGFTVGDSPAQRSAQNADEDAFKLVSEGRRFWSSSRSAR